MPVGVCLAPSVITYTAPSQRPPKASPSILVLGWSLSLWLWLLSDLTLDIDLVDCWLPASFWAPWGHYTP